MIPAQLRFLIIGIYLVLDNYRLPITVGDQNIDLVPLNFDLDTSGRETIFADRNAHLIQQHLEQLFPLACTAGLISAAINLECSRTSSDSLRSTLNRLKLFLRANWRRSKSTIWNSPCAAATSTADFPPSTTPAPFDH
ncbi:hypothetical protein [Alkalilimnicola ehrlichii]|uniref:hypothetical protein n=1 Tax=Alkalilimnicola ehrlichii TaxID=351052 RepID=UPI002161E1F4|nr:hypothetical protein [Alkalilimnicola ehrlichii]